MEMDFEKAFSYITADKDWKKKLAIGGGLSLLCVILCLLPFLFLIGKAQDAFIPLFIICGLLNIFIILGLVGYPYVVANNRINNNPEILPQWSDFGKLMGAGVKFGIGYFLFSIPLSLAYVIGTGLVAAAAVAGNDSSGAVLGVIFTLIVFVIMALAFVYTLITMLMLANFTTDLKVLSFINFKAAYGLIKDNWVNYLILFLLVIAVSIILQLAACVLAITVIGLLFVPLLVFYSQLVTAELLAQFVKSKTSN